MLVSSPIVVHSVKPIVPKPFLGVLAVLALFAVLGFGIRWAMHASARLSSSDRQINDWKKW